MTVTYTGKREDVRSYGPQSSPGENRHSELNLGLARSVHGGPKWHDVHSSGRAMVKDLIRSNSLKNEQDRGHNYTVTIENLENIYIIIVCLGTLTATE